MCVNISGNKADSDSSDLTRYHIDLMLFYHVDTKIQTARKYIPFIVINNMKCIYTLYYINVSQAAEGS